MAFAKVYSAQMSGLDAHIVTVEVDLARGLHAFSIVGLPDKAVEESRDRFAAAIKNTGFTSPKEKNQKVVVALAPAELKKEGANFDLPIALAYLQAAGDVTFDPEEKLFLGELSLDGVVRPIRGTLPLVREAARRGFRDVFVPSANTREAALVEGIRVYAIQTLRDIVRHLHHGAPNTKKLTPAPRTPLTYTSPPYHVDLSDIRGQETAKRGLEIAAAGGHNVLLYGPPGTGKTMLAKAFAGILPPLPLDEALEVTGIHSTAGTLSEDVITHPPFRSPHHTASYVAIVGGGTHPRPGEITLAHRGVLFLDEFPEFDRRVIEALRQPLEERIVSVARARGSAEFPADVVLVAAMNPCPCGNFGSDSSTTLGTGKPCTCPPASLERYRRKLSGPILDRIDISLEVGNVLHEKLSHAPTGEKSDVVRERVRRARAWQEKRFAHHRDLRTNSAMGVRELDTLVTLDKNSSGLLDRSAKTLGLSARSYHKAIKLARTIADLSESDDIEAVHILEALSYRPKLSIGL